MSRDCRRASAVHADYALTLSVDVYRIDVRDRIGLLQRYTLTPEEQSDLVASGVAAAQGLTGFNFFVNGYQTRTEGLDAVLSYRLDLHTAGQLAVIGAANLDRTKVQSFSDGVIDARQRQYLEKRLPRHVETVTLEYTLARLGVVLRGRHYGKWTEPLSPTTDDRGNLVFNQTFGDELFVDLMLSYAFTPNVQAERRRENIFRGALNS